MLRTSRLMRVEQGAMIRFRILRPTTIVFPRNSRCISHHTKIAMTGARRFHPASSMTRISFLNSPTSTSGANANASVAPTSLASSEPSVDDIEEPDFSRQETVHEHEPAAHEPPQAPMQGLPHEQLEAVSALFTSEELRSLVDDLKAFQAAHPFMPAAPDSTATLPPISPEPIPPAKPSSSTSSSSAATAASSMPSRPFLASWSVKEVCSWYLQIEEQLGSKHTSDSEAAKSSTTSSSMDFISLLQKHGIDGARLLNFTSDPQLIPLISPHLLSSILYLRGLDTYSHMFQPHSASLDDNTMHADPNMRHLQTILHSTVKIFCTSTPSDFARPWQASDQVDSTSSGFVIAGRRILGNAHGATSATQIRVRKHGDATKYKARVKVISHESDLVILEVDSDKFWKGLEPLPFGHVPRLQDTVIVVGYPSGGDSICVTKGVVSRILVTNYVHSDESLLTCQIDAAINSGNSGGPVLLNGAVVGVAFQGVSSAQSVGYIIPMPVLQHFLTDLQLHGKYTGFPSFSGISFQKLENESLKKYFGLDPDQTGIIVMDRPATQRELGHDAEEEGGGDGQADAKLQAQPTSNDAQNQLQPNDVLTHIDSIPIADDGSIFFRHGERISCRYLPTSKFVGDSIKLRVIRNKKPLEISYELKQRKHLVPTHLYDQTPSYYILAGMVFTPLSRPYLIDTFGKNWVKRAPVDLIQLAYYGTQQRPDQQVVLLSTILVDDVNTGYGVSFHNIQLVSLNGVKIWNLKHLVEQIEKEAAAGADFLRFDFTLNRLIILETKLALESTKRILQQNAIEFDRSADLRQETENQNNDKTEK